MSVLTLPMRTWSLRERWVALALAVALGAGTSLALVDIPSVFHAPDSTHYLKIAVGQTSTVMQPFASRQLGARAAAALAYLVHADIGCGFLLEAALSLLFTMGVTCWLALQTSAPRWLLVALMLLPSWIMLVDYLVLPDLWYAALLAGFMLLLARQRWLAAALMMFPLMLSRESTSLTLICFLIAAWPRLEAWRRWWILAIAVFSAVAGSVVVGRLAASSLPNREHLPEAIYIFAKLPWNFLRNVVGILPWSDANPELCTIPAWSIPVHLAGPLASVQRLGICGFSFRQQLLAVESTLTRFGILPLIVAFLWWRHRRGDQAATGGRSVLLRFSLLYGAVSYLLTPLIGAGFAHLMQYAWPLFLVALPRLFDEFDLAAIPAGRQKMGAVLLVLHLAIPVILLWPDFLLRLALLIVVWVAGYLILRGWFGPATVAENC